MQVRANEGGGLRLRGSGVTMSDTLKLSTLMKTTTRKGTPFLAYGEARLYPQVGCGAFPS